MDAKKDRFWRELTLNRASAVTLSAQLADAIREAIDEGIYRSGETLPSQLEIARILGTSARVPREAFAELAVQRVAVARPRLGCVVLPRRAAAKRGRIVFAVRESMAVGYYVTVFENALRARLVRSGYTFVRVVMTTEHGKRGEYAELDEALSHPNALIIAMDDEPETFDRIRASGATAVAIGIRRGYRLDGLEFIRLGVADALPDFVGHCRKADVRRVTQFSFGTWNDASSLLRDEGIRVESHILGPVRAKSVQEGVQRAGLEAVLARYGRGGKTLLPDVLLFTDDYLAAGALTGLALLGIRVPEDVRVAVFANAGSGPVYPIPLTRMEMDPAEDAVRVAAWLKPVLAGKPLPANAVLRPRYIRGKTFA